ncbi:hypothetical protein SO802_010206 [Lithocarpus litseifolius]|uniref:Uncharacterized protein n=1 Tax=Lithocarpus litseifolius TaxID=425828 RepID=A0AAW2DF14_9ROSI
MVGPEVSHLGRGRWYTLKELEDLEILPPFRSASSKDIDKCLSSLANDDGVSVEVKKYLDLVESKVFGEGRAKWCLVPDEDSAFLESLDWDSKLTKSLQESKSKEERSESGGSLINPIGGIQQ